MFCGTGNWEALKLSIYQQTFLLFDPSLNGVKSDSFYAENAYEFCPTGLKLNYELKAVNNIN